MANTFNDIDNAMLRTWNRCTVAYNLKEDNGEDACEKYISQIDKRGQKQMAIMFRAIEIKGREAIRKEVMESCG